MDSVAAYSPGSSQKPGDKGWEEIQYPVAHRMLEKCDAVLRLEGASKWADEDVRKRIEGVLQVGRCAG